MGSAAARGMRSLRASWKSWASSAALACWRGGALWGRGGVGLVVVEDLGVRGEGGEKEEWDEVLAHWLFGLHGLV